MRFNFRLFEDKCRVDITYVPTMLKNEVIYAAKQNRRINILKLIIRIGEMFANIAQVCRTKQGITNCVNQHIGV